MLTIPLSKLCYIIVKAREFDAEVESDDLEDGSNAADDSAVGVLEDSPDNPAFQELTDALDSLNEDERIEVLALAWLGRGDFEAGEWKQALQQAADSHNARETDYLAGMPMLGDFLEDGLAQMGGSCHDVEMDHL